MKQIQESRLRSRTGFALPLTIFLVSIISVMLATTFTRAATEHLVSGSTASEVAVLAVAQSGLQAFMGDTNIITRPAPTDSFRYNVAGGYAWVKPEVFMVPADTLSGTYTYIVRSAGYYIEPAQGSVPQASRTVAQFADWQTGFLRPTGAYTAANGIFWDSPATPPIVSIDGNDEASCAVLDTTGFQGPSGSGSPGAAAAGVPPIIISGLGGGGVAAATGIDWNAIVNNGAIVPDYPGVINGDNTFATYVYGGDPLLTNVTSTGLLIAGVLTISGSFDWEGVVLVGDKLYTGTATSINVRGTLITGLNLQLPSPVPISLLNEDGVDFIVQYNSCNVRQALRRFRGFVPLENTWIDNWSTY